MINKILIILKVIKLILKKKIVKKKLNKHKKRLSIYV